MASMRISFFILLGVFFVQTKAANKYTDENRPYEFGFTIDGEQHRHEKKDENGIIMGEFGFITADGVYHVTVYATDENGNFKILSMKNIRVKPYPTAPGVEVKREYSSNYPSAPKDSIPESTKTEKIIKHQISSPAKSCSHCSLPPTTTLPPTLPKEGLKTTNNPILGSNNQNTDRDKTKQIVLPENKRNLQQDYDSKITSLNSKNANLNYNEQKQINEDVENKDSVISRTFSYEKQTDERMPVSQITADPQMRMVSGGILQTINQGGEENQHKNSINTEQQIQIQEAPLSSKGQNYPVAPQTASVSQLRNQDIPPISRNLQGPKQEDNLLQKESVERNNQPLFEINNPLQNRPQEQQGNYEQLNKVNDLEKPNYSNMYTTDPQKTQQDDKPIGYSINKQPIQKYTNTDRNPKSFFNFIQQAEGPEDIAKTGPNLNRPSLPNLNTLTSKPELFAAQMQIVDKNTDIHHLNAGERVGLPSGLTKDDMSNLLYTFNYTVGFHGHHEKGYANGDKQGYYYVTGRNGVRTRVDYVADDTGFHPKITREILDILSDEVPKPETEKDEKYGLKGYEFKWLYFPVENKHN